MPVITRYWKILTGTLLAVAGSAAIVIAWFRVRDLLEVADQVPILVSGGLGGVTLVIGGIWLLRSHEHDMLMTHLRDTTLRLGRLEDDVAQLSSLFAGALVEIEPVAAGNGRRPHPTLT